MSFLDRPEGRLAIAIGIGMVIGAERERRKGDAATRQPAGIRTFAVVGLLGGIVALLGNTALLAIAAAFIGGLAIAGYWLGNRSDPGFTTEVALVLTFFLGVLADQQPKLALGAGLLTATLLAMRAPLHRAVRSVLSEDELRDALLFAVAAVVVLPLLPNRTVDPLGVLNPFTLWRLVVLLMGMSGAGYIAQRAIGPRYGLALAGFASGFVSSAATIATMGGRARADAQLVRPAVAGAAASTVSTFVQLAILVGAADPRLLAALRWPFLAGGGTALVYAVWETWRASRAEAAPVKGSPFKLSTALLFASLVTLISFISTLARQWIGPAGAIGAGALAGFADAHAASAAVASVTAGDQLGLTGGQLGVLLAVTANTVTKIILAATSGPRGFSWRVILGLVLVLLATWGVAGALLLRG